MNNIAVVVIKFLLASLSSLTMLLSAFLITLCFNLWLQTGMPPFENIKFTIFLFVIILILLVICACLKFHLDIAKDNRDMKDVKVKKRVDDVNI